jgi:hypothetical protein
MRNENNQEVITMKKQHKLNIGAIISLAGVLYIMYHILIFDGMLPLSISTIMDTLSHCIKHWHILVIALIPVYIALVLFSTAAFGIYLGNILQHWIVHRLNQKNCIRSNAKP